MKLSTILFSPIVAAMLSVGVFGIASAQNSSPCAEGMAPNDPRHPDVICLPELGRMTGFIPHCTPGRSEGFGQSVRALSDVNGDNLADWTITHYRCDTVVNGRTPNEVMLYKGIQKGLPSAEDGKRIGPTEIGSETTLLASGDWDADGHVDIAARVQVYGDTIGGNRTGYDVAHLVIFWGNDESNYTVSDTTRLQSEAEAWLWIGPSASDDFDGDDVDDLCIYNGNGFSDGKLFAIPILNIYRGGQRWGRNGTSRTSIWHWWNAPNTNRFEAKDQDGDGVLDFIFLEDINAGTGFVAILYGKSALAFPDTTDFQQVDLFLPNGHSSLFADVTGDKIPELLVHAGSEEQIKVFIGLKGQRLLQQFGTGNDPERPGEKEWWGKPWARIWLPRKIASNWPESDWLSVGDISGMIDGNLNGVGDIWVYAQPFLLMYNGGQFMDSLVDAMSNELPMNYWRGLTNLGDIDGSGVPSFAFATGNGVIYLKPSRNVPTSGRRRDLPPGTGKASVDDAPDAPPALTLTAIPNPVNGEVRVQWESPITSGDAAITIHDIAGREISSFHAPAHQRSAVWNTESVAAGTYLITVHLAASSTTVTVVLR